MFNVWWTLHFHDKYRNCHLWICRWQGVHYMDLTHARIQTLSLVGMVSVGWLCMWIGAQHWLFMPGKSPSTPDGCAHWSSLIGMRMRRVERKGLLEMQRARGSMCTWLPGLNFPAQSQGAVPKHLLIVNLVLDTAASQFVHVLKMTTFYSGHEYTGRRAESCERSIQEKRNASHPQVNFRQNVLPASILKQSHLQKIVTPDGYIHPASYSSCTLPSNIAKTRTKFLNLRDSVKKSPTKSTAKSSGSGERFSGRVDTLRALVSFEKVC